MDDTNLSLKSNLFTNLLDENTKNINLNTCVQNISKLFNTIKTHYGYYN